MGFDLFGIITGGVNAIVDQGADALGLSPEIKEAAKVGIGLLTGDVLTAMQGAAGSGSSSASQGQPARTEMAQSDPLEPPPGYSQRPSWAIAQQNAQAQSASQSLDPKTLEFRDALTSLLRYWELFDTAVGDKDFLITKENLRAIHEDPGAPPELKAAAKFLLENPVYFNRLEMAAGVGGKDGTISNGDVVADLQKVNQEISQAPSSSNGRTGNPGQAGFSRGSDQDSFVADSSNDSLSSLGEPMNKCISNAMANLDAQIQEAMKAVEEGKSEWATYNLQGLITRRTQMFTMVSNLMANMNEMAKTALGNMARA